jgi:hypothetical protein
MVSPIFEVCQRILMEPWSSVADSERPGPPEFHVIGENASPSPRLDEFTTGQDQALAIRASSGRQHHQVTWQSGR